MTLGAIFTPTLAAVLKISFGSFKQAAYLGPLQLFLLAKCSPLRDCLISSFPFPDASPVLLFDQGLVRWILLVYPGAMGMNEKQACEKVRSQTEKSEYFSPLFARIILCDIWNVSWIIHGWLATAELMVRAAARCQKCYIHQANLHKRENYLFCSILKLRSRKKWHRWQIMLHPS